MSEPGCSTTTPSFPAGEVDPRCLSKNKELAALWPVYVSNFRCHRADYLDATVRMLFGNKGYPIRWWFIHKDKHYSEFQMQAGLYDFLVYFSTESDALAVIQAFHRFNERGFVMNVLPGREPVYFCEDRSFYAKNINPDTKVIDRIMDERFRTYLTCSTRIDSETGAVEFSTPEAATQVRMSTLRCTVEPMKANIQKQRYLEKDALPWIEARLQRQPKALQSNPAIPQVHPSQRSRVDPSVTAYITSSHTRSQVRAKLNKMKREIEKRLDQGLPIKNFDKSKRGKERFRAVMEEVMNERGLQY